MQSAHLKIEGMSCGHCVSRVTSTLKGLPGVDVMNVAIGSADVRIDPARASADVVVAAVTAAGYPANADLPTDPLAVVKGCGAGCGCGTK